MKVRQRRERFRAILNGASCVAPASVFDPLSARIAEDLGFETGVLGGSVASMAVTGAPDLMGLTLTEFAQQIHRICRAGDLSLIVDADDGYGNAINVMRTIEELETAGTAALTLEDTLLPPPFGAPSADQLVSLEEGVGKMRAALAARSDPDLVVVGRTSAAATAGIDEAIRRLKAYVEAGVDAIFPVGVKTREELAAIHRAIDAPMVFYSESAALADLSYLATQGVRVALQGHATFTVAMKAVHDTLKALRDGVAPADLPGRPEGDFMKRLSRKADYDRRFDEFLR
jgi:carboxyvinyl-carboxyphosphonate phosphorylmutase